MSPEHAPPAPSPLRLWPGLALVALLWALRFVPGMVSDVTPAIFMLAFFGPAICALLVVLWWAAASRASGREKLAGAGGFLLLLVVGTVLSHPTMRGFGTLGTLLPWAATAFVAGLVVARWIQPGRRTAIALLAAGLVIGALALVRADGVWGDFSAERSWRWQKTAEESYLAAGPEDAGATVSGALGDAEWPGFRGPGRDAVVAGVSLAEDWAARPPRELWRIRVGPGWSSFAVAGRRLFTQEQRGENEVVAAYDAETGAQLWVQEYRSRFFEALGGAGPRATPTLADGMLFALGAEGLLHRLEPTSGEVVWQADLRLDAGRQPPTWGFSSSPLVVDGLVIVHAGGAGDRGVLAYDVEDGRLRWGAPAGGHSYSSPQLSRIAGRSVVPMVTDAGLTVVDPGGGAVVWRHDWPFEQYRVLQPLAVGDSTLLVSTGMGVGTRRLDLRRDGDGLAAEERWTSRGLKPDFNDVVAHEGFLYGLDPGILACIDLETGERQWKGGRYGNGQLLLLPEGDQLLVLTETGDVVLVRATPAGHEELTRLEVLDAKTWNHPVLVGDRLYLRNGEEAVALEMPLG